MWFTLTFLNFSILTINTAKSIHAKFALEMKGILFCSHGVGHIPDTLASCLDTLGFANLCADDLIGLD